MSLSKRRLETYQKYYGVKLESVREFDDTTGHTVILFHESHQDESRGKRSWTRIMCPCDLMWRWTTRQKTRMLVHTADGFCCGAKENVRKVIREEIRQQYGNLWALLLLADAVEDIFRRHWAGEYLGEHNPGMLYVQDVESLLGITPDTRTFHLGEARDNEGNVVGDQETFHIPFPSEVILAAVEELKRRKIVDLNGMIIIPHREHFRFPSSLHHQLALWIEEPLGWPNGDAGDCFVADLCERVEGATGWTCGEEVFGKENIPNLSSSAKEHFFKRWLSNLEKLRPFTFPVGDEASRGMCREHWIRSLTIEQWVYWLRMIREEITGGKCED